MEPFATVADLEARWRPLTPTEQAQALVLIADASAILRAVCPDIDARLGADPPTLDQALVVMIVCAMVRRAMVAGAGDLGEGVSSLQQAAGPFSRSVSYANPNGNVYVTKRERSLLGCASQRAFMIDTLPDRAAYDPLAVIVGEPGPELVDLDGN